MKAAALFAALAIFGGALPAHAQVPAIVQTAPLTGGSTVNTHVVIWLHPTQPEASVVFASDNLNGGLYAFDVSGRSLSAPLAEQVYGLDLKHNVPLGEESLDLMAIAAASGLRLYSVGLDGGVNVLNSGGTTPGIVSAVALMRPTNGSPMTMWLGYDTGQVAQYSLTESMPGETLATHINTFTFPSAISGLVADDANGRLYVSGGFGVHYLTNSGSDARLGDAGVLFNDPNGLASLGHLSLARIADGRALLLVPDLDVDWVKVFGPGELLPAAGAFRVTADAGGVGGALRTPVAAVMPTAIPAHFDGGLLVTFDSMSARLKFVDWAEAVKPLGFDPNPGFDPRQSPGSPGQNDGGPQGDGGTQGDGGAGTGGGSGGGTVGPAGGGKPGGSIIGDEPARPCGCSTGAGALALLASLFFFRSRRNR